ncbi:MAG: hypothetical protein GKC04_07305, partial [Methanomicrobiales archaeon]|nr:hypothetical protein [Methanomicrobiales archaeon]
MCWNAGHVDASTSYRNAFPPEVSNHEYQESQENAESKRSDESDCVQEKERLFASGFNPG